jgi:hypothetical protein
MNTFSIDASEARNDFFRILDKIYLEDKTFIIKKAGIPIVQMRKPKLVTKDTIAAFSGLWKDEGTIIAKNTKRLRTKSKFIAV